MFNDQDRVNDMGEESINKHVISEYRTIKEPSASDASDLENSEGSEVELVDSTENTPCESRSLTTKTGIALYPLADDFDNLAHRLMKPLHDYPVKDSTHFVWEVHDWSSAKNENKLVSPSFDCGGYKWNILMFPRGNSEAISLYMEPHPPTDADGKPDPDWYVCAQFALDIWNPLYPASHYPSGSSHRFNKNETDWGFASFIFAKDLANPLKVGQSRPILENNRLNITGFVRVIDDTSTGVLWSNFIDYDSKKHTGFVGLNNQGATCYLNSLLQSYFTTKTFKNLVCQIPTCGHFSDENTGNSSKTVALALQRTFYLMQTSSEPVGTMELTKSFGWDSGEAFTQHDVQELNRVLMDKLELAMKGTQIENTLNDIFVGKMKSFIKCVNVAYESSRVEDFWDIQLNVKGFKNLKESFENYIEIEMLDGENKYQAGEGFGYQDAKKGVVFQSFPPVLHLQLKRFEYDFMVDDLVKIDDFYEFPDSIDLSPYLDGDLGAEVKNQNWIYKLHGVLVHQGSISNGHYYAMIKPEADSSWLRFDDDRVWKVTESQVFTENFGAVDLSSEEIRLLTRVEQNEYLIRKATSAYMLVYYRERNLCSILPNTSASFPIHVSGQIDNERAELAKSEESKREAQHYLQVKIVTVNNFAHFNGFDICPDLTNTKEYDSEIFEREAYPVTLKVRKDAKFCTLYKLVAQALGFDFSEDLDFMCDSDVDTASTLSGLPFSLMIMKQRNNKTNRPGLPVPLKYHSESLNQVYNKCFRRRYDEFSFFVQERSKNLFCVNKSSSISDPRFFSFDTVSARISGSNSSLFLPETGDSITLFLKYYDVVSDSIRGLTYVTISRHLRPAHLLDDVNSLLGFPKKTKLEIFEEVSRLKIEPINVHVTFEKNELGTGDILTFQLAEASSYKLNVKLGNTKDYYNYLLTRVHLKVKPCTANDAEEDNDVLMTKNDTESSEDLVADNTETKMIGKTKQPSKIFDLWVSTTYSYEELSKAIAQNIGPKVDPAYLRLFYINNTGAKVPLSFGVSLDHIFTKQVAVSSKTYFEYEILNITLKEYESMKAVKIYWLDNIYQTRLFDFLVPRTSSVCSVIKKLVQKLEIPQEKQSGLLVWTGQDNKYVDIIKFEKPIEEISDDVELYCGYFPAEVEILVSHDMLRRYVEAEFLDGREISDPVIKKEFQNAQRYCKMLNIIPVYHFHKSTAYTHSIPFIFAVFPNESIQETQERLRKKLGLGIPAFDKMRLALADQNDKGKYLDVQKEGLNLLDEITRFDSHVSLALDHRDRNSKRANPLEKGISIG